jgi:hypothetical protein
MKSRWDKALKGLSGVSIVDFDYDSDEAEVRRHAIGTILPVVIFEKDGVEQERIIGEVSLKDLLKALQKWSE